MSPRPTRSPHKTLRKALIHLVLLISLTVSGLTLGAAPATAEFDGSAVEAGFTKAIDAILIRPVSLVRFVVGATLMIPAGILSSPGGADNLRDVFDLLVQAPAEYAFERELGEF